MLVTVVIDWIVDADPAADQMLMAGSGDQPVTSAQMISEHVVHHIDVTLMSDAQHIEARQNLHWNLH